MDETKLNELLVKLYLHVASMPWADTGFTRSAVAQGAAQDHIVNTIRKEILELCHK